MHIEKPVIDKFLQPGDFAVGDAKCRFRTVLGSCVSITLWHPQHRIGAMSHFLLAWRTAGRNDSGWHLPARRTADWDGRYGEEAMCLMVHEFERAGVAVDECIGKIFGGANMFPGISMESLNVGRQNGEAARRLLRAHGIPIASENLFGVGHRQVRFDVGTGHVWMRQIEPVEPFALRVAA